VRNPFQVAAIVPLRRKGANHTLGRRPVCIECSRYYDAVKSEEKAKHLVVDIQGWDRWHKWRAEMEGGDGVRDM